MNELMQIRMKAANDKLAAKLKQIQEKHGGEIKAGVRTVLVGGSSLAAAYVDARFPNKTVFGIPNSALIGAVATGVALSGMAGKDSFYLAAVGDGAFAAYAAQKGVEYGAKALAEANKKDSTPGYKPA